MQTLYYTLSFANDQVLLTQDEEYLIYMVTKSYEYTKEGLAVNLENPNL